jgi:hypothetical protein
MAIGPLQTTRGEQTTIDGNTVTIPNLILLVQAYNSLDISEMTL